jgi:hypothetical protein
MNMLKMLVRAPMFSILLMAAASVEAAQLSADARTAIPHDVQQLIVIDYKAMQNSTAATNLRERLMPAELKPFDEALRKSGLNENHDVEQLAFALFRTKDSGDTLTTVGIAQGQFPIQEITASFRKRGFKATMVRSNRIYPMPKTGMVVSFIDASTMIFGTPDAVRKSLDARDGQAASMLTNPTMMEAMKSVDTEPLWSVLDDKGTQFMVHQLLGNAGSVTDFETVQKHLQSCRYGMDFQHGVHLNLSIETGDNFIAATLSSIFNAAITLRKMSAPEVEKQALAATSIYSNLGNLEIQFATSNDEFASLLNILLSPVDIGVSVYREIDRDLVAIDSNEQNKRI